MVVNVHVVHAARSYSCCAGWRAIRCCACCRVIRCACCRTIRCCACCRTIRCCACSCTCCRACMLRMLCVSCMCLCVHVCMFLHASAWYYIVCCACCCCCCCTHATAAHMLLLRMLRVHVLRMFWCKPASPVDRVSPPRADEYHSMDTSSLRTVCARRDMEVTHCLWSYTACRWFQARHFLWLHTS